METPNSSSTHKSSQQLHTELIEARAKVKIDGIYSHYKHPENTYKVLNLAFIEASDQISVVYQSTGDSDLLFVRPVDSWLEILEFDNKKVPRFTLVS